MAESERVSRQSRTEESDKRPSGIRTPGDGIDTGKGTSSGNVAGDRSQSDAANAVEHDADLRRKQIEQAAYRRAEQRNFQGDGHLEDWLDAEREIDSLAGSGGIQGEASKRSEGPSDLSAGAIRQDGVADWDGQEIEPDEIKRWAETLAVSPEKLRSAIERVGTRVADVKRYLQDLPSE